MLTGAEIGRQLITAAGCAFDRRHRAAASVPLAAVRPILGGRHDRRLQRHLRRLSIFHRHAWILRRDALDGRWQYADIAHCLNRCNGPRAIQTTPERISFFQQLADTHAFNFDNQIFDDLAASSGGVLERDFAVHGQSMDGVAVQIEDERFFGGHCNVNHIRQQPQRAALVLGRADERTVERQEILIRRGGFDLCRGRHLAGRAGRRRHGAILRRAVVTDLRADGACTVVPSVRTRANRHGVARFGRAAQVEQRALLPEQAFAIQIVGQSLAVHGCLDAVAVPAFCKCAALQDGIACCLDPHAAGIRAAVKFHRAISHHLYDRSFSVCRGGHILQYQFGRATEVPAAHEDRVGGAAAAIQHAVLDRHMTFALHHVHQILGVCL